MLFAQEAAPNTSSIWLLTVIAVGASLLLVFVFVLFLVLLFRHLRSVKCGFRRKFDDESVEALSDRRNELKDFADILEILAKWNLSFPNVTLRYPFNKGRIDVI